MFSEELGSNFCWNKNIDKSSGTLDEKGSRAIVLYVAPYKNVGCGCISSQMPL